MSSYKRLLRIGLQNLGFNVQRYPVSDPTWRLVQLLKRFRVDQVLDIGANQGQFARDIRRHGYSGRITSYEPVSDSFAELERSAQRDPDWTAVRIALGREDTEVRINVAANGGASSSVLPMLPLHREAAPEAVYVRDETVRMTRLDALDPPTGCRVFLKLDVQGLEGSVLDGARDLLAAGRVIGLQLELSFAELYAGGMSWQEGLARAEDLGLTLMSITPGFFAPDGRMLQADVTFFREATNGSNGPPL